MKIWDHKIKSKHCILLLFLLHFGILAVAQKMSMSQTKAAIENAQNPVAYVRDQLKLKYKLDTVVITSTSSFAGIADSLAYHGKLRKVYGPFEKKYLVQVLAKSPNTFNRVSQIFIDTSVFVFKIADSLSKHILSAIYNGTSSFEDMAQLYSMDGAGNRKGDLGWVAQGALLPEIEKLLAKSKKGQLIKIWSSGGVHIIKKTAEPKQDHGFALLMRILL